MSIYLGEGVLFSNLKGEKRLLFLVSQKVCGVIRLLFMPDQ